MQLERTRYCEFISGLGLEIVRSRGGLDVFRFKSKGWELFVF